MHRRRFLELTSLAIAGALSSNRVTAIIEVDGRFAVPLRSVIGDDAAALVSAMCERIIPKTQTPGAVDVGCPGFIADVLTQVYLEEEQVRFAEGVHELDARAVSRTGEKYAALDSSNQDAFLAEIESEGKGEAYELFAEIRQLTVFGYYTSEQGAYAEHEVVDWMAPWEGDIAYSGRMIRS